MQTAVLTKEILLALITENDAKIKALGVARLQLFGSFLRGEQNPQSDIDFLVDFEPGMKTETHFEELANLLTNLTGRKISLIPISALDKYIGPYILRDIASGGSVTMKKSPLPYLKHILDEIEYLIYRSNNLSEAEFLANADLQRAFVRSLEIIGEAAKKVPLDFRNKYAQVDWKGMAGMRDRLIHEYDTVNFGLVWQVLTREIPRDKQSITQIIAEESQSDE